VRARTTGASSRIATRPDVEADHRRPCLGERGEQAPVMRVPEVARLAVLAQVLDVDADHRHVARGGLRRETAPQLEPCVEQLAVGERHRVPRLRGDRRQGDGEERRHGKGFHLHRS